MIKTIIVEDDLMVQDINKNILLSVEGFCLKASFCEVSSAISYLLNNEIDLILLDLTLPNTDGIELIRKIKSEFSKIDIIVISARNDSLSLQKSLNLGVIDYILKPFKQNRLESSLNQYKLRKELLLSEINQENIDKALYKQIDDLPKGIDKNSLALIKENIKNFSTWFNVNELENLVGISKISLRKYLNYLEQTNYLSSKLEYKAKGRPQIYYKIN
ncbi:two-component system response regulator [Campylobacter sp. RM5004]|uniref:response regulator n=1 Tax=Campylobacter sp. RM5004 TaxID=1660078 RepID=UPI001EFB2ABC|nr:response regulator [Campylobacter sp. RM5004]ULO01517.1 two-component system response regulator [Campylobacter sp. RM5004]